MQHVFANYNMGAVQFSQSHFTQCVCVNRNIGTVQFITKYSHELVTSDKLDAIKQTHYLTCYEITKLGNVSR